MPASAGSGGGGKRRRAGHPDAPPPGGEDTIGAVLRNPESVYVYWDLGGVRSREALRELGPDCEWVLRVLDLSEGTSKGISVDPEAGGRYVEVRPGRTYGFELAATAGGTWRTICRTERLEAPLGRPGPEVTSPGLRKLRPSEPDRAVPGLRYETTEPYLAASPGRSTEQDG
ncbi:MAG: DUF4912 domain-containing protein [Candidatus Brocadiaceae bacterium]|jgi:hypothetical protein